MFAAFDAYGQGCQGSFPAPTYCASLNPNGGTLSNSTNSFEYCYQVSGLGSVQVQSFDIYTQSNSGTITRPAHIYLPSGGGPSGTPVATTTITVGTTPGFYTATFAAPVSVSGTFYIGYENSPGGVISNLNGGAAGVGYYRTAVTGSWNQSGLVNSPSWRVDCGQGSGFSAPEIGNVGLPSLGSSYDVTVSRAATSTFAVLLSGLSDTVYQGTPLPAALPGAPGCDLQASADVTSAQVVSSTGTASGTINVPNAPSLMGLPVYHQWAVLDSVNALGIVVSDAGRATVGI